MSNSIMKNCKLVTIAGLIGSPMALLADEGLSDVVKNVGGFWSVVLTLILAILIGLGLIAVGVGLWKLLNKDKDPQGSRGAPMMIMVGIVLISVPVLIGLATGEFFGEEAKVEDITKDPFLED